VDDQSPGGLGEAARDRDQLPADGRRRDFGVEYRCDGPGGEVKLDAVVMRQPGVNLPHYVHRAPDKDGGLTGMMSLADLAVISELKVAATAGQGLDHKQVAQDVYKLSMLLEQAELRGIQPPLAYLGILDNNAGRGYRRPGLDKRLEAIPHHPAVRILMYPEPTSG